MTKLQKKCLQLNKENRGGLKSLGRQCFSFRACPHGIWHFRTKSGEQAISPFKVFPPSPSQFTSIKFNQKVFSSNIEFLMWCWADFYIDTQISYPCFQISNPYNPNINFIIQFKFYIQGLTLCRWGTSLVQISTNTNMIFDNQIISSFWSIQWISRFWESQSWFWPHQIQCVG